MRGRFSTAALAVLAMAGIGAATSIPGVGERSGQQAQEARAAVERAVDRNSPADTQRTRGGMSESLMRSGGFGWPTAGNVRRHTGMTNRRYQRAAAKRRNQARNRRAHRG